MTSQEVVTVRVGEVEDETAECWHRQGIRYGEAYKILPCIGQRITIEQNVLNILLFIQILAGRHLAITTRVLGPEPTHKLSPVPSTKEKCLDLGFNNFIRRTSRCYKDWMRGH